MLQLAPLLMHEGLGVTVDRDGVIEARNPHNSRMRQPFALRDHQGALWWHWVWSGPTRDAPWELEPMVPVHQIEEASRRIANVLSVFDA